MRLKCGATAWTARPRLLSTHSRVASRAVHSTRFAALAIRGPRILRPTRLMFSQPMSLLVSDNLVLSGRVKNVYRRLLRFLTLMFSNKVKTINIFSICYFWDRVNPLRLSDTYMCRLSHKIINLIFYSRKAFENIMCKTTAILSQHKCVRLWKSQILCKHPILIITQINIDMSHPPMKMLTHLHLDKMASISQTIFSNAFSWTKNFVFWF